MQGCLETFSVCQGHGFSITPVDTPNCFSVCGRCTSRPSALSPPPPLLPPQSPAPPWTACARPTFSSWTCNGIAYPSLACCSSGSLGGLTCVTEGLTSVFDVGAVPRCTLRFLLPPSTGRADDRRLKKQLSHSLNIPLKLPFPGLSYSPDTGLLVSELLSVFMSFCEPEGQSLLHCRGAER